MSAPSTVTPGGTGLQIHRIILWAMLLAFAAFFLTPLYVMVSTSLKDLDQIRNGNLMSIPTSPGFDAWAKAWSTACTGVDCNGLKPFFMNSVYLVVPAVLISTAVGAVNGYVLSKWKFRGSEFMFALLLFGVFMPMQVVLLPMSQVLGWLDGSVSSLGFWLIEAADHLPMGAELVVIGSVLANSGSLHLSSSISGLILIHVIAGIPSTTLFFRNYYVGLPDELIKAAMLDGAGFWRIFWRIVLPLSTPILVVTLIWQFTNIWNDFLYGVVFSGADSKPITVGLNNLANTTTSVKEYNVDMAAAMIAGLPTLLVYVLAGKYFVRGLTAGAVKG